MLKYVQLQQQFDAAKMAVDIATLEATHWQKHYNKRHYEGGWTVLPLRSINGEIENIFAVHVAGNNAGEYRDTMLLETCPNIQSVINFFQCSKTAVRLMKLHAGAMIREHRDTALCFEEGEARLHIPIVTNPDVTFCLDKEKLHLKKGECWYMNLCLKHSVRNDGPTDRVHLVIDCLVNDWLRNLLATQISKKKYVDAPESVGYDTTAKQKMISELRLMNTPTALALAAQLENELL